MNALTPVAVWLGSLSWLPRLLPQITALDKLIQRLTRGSWSLLRIAGLPGLMLTVKGRKSGEPRTTPLLCVPWSAVERGEPGGPEGHLIAGSNFGGAKSPVWVVNVRAAQERGEPVTIRTRQHGRTTTRPADVRELIGAERDRAWAHMLRTWPNYARYAERTGRTIPVFLLLTRASDRPAWSVRS